MGSTEALDLLKRLTLLFPALSDDEPRCRGMLRELQGVSRDAGQQAVDEYMSQEGEKYLNFQQVMAIARRIDMQARERDAAVEKARARAAEVGNYARRTNHLEAADEIISDMTDDEVLKEWAPILAGMQGKPREWAEKWSVAKIRTNIQLRLHVAGLAGVK